MTAQEFEIIKRDCLQHMKSMDTSIKGVEHTPEYKKMCAYNQVIQDILPILEKPLGKICITNIKSYSLKYCIFMPIEEFEELILELTDGLKQVCYETDGIFYDDTKKVDETDTYWNEDMNETLSRHFRVNVTSVHADDSEHLGIWICYALTSDSQHASE